MKQRFKISFDFDDCLDDNEHLQMLAQILIKADIEVFILTCRVDDGVVSNNDMFKKAEKLGISKSNIIFVGMGDKQLFMKELDITIHFDDNADTVDRINRFFDSPNSLNKRAFLVNLDLQDILHTFWELQKE